MDNVVKDSCRVEGCGRAAVERINCKAGEVHCWFVEVGLDGDLYVGNSLVRLYVRWADGPREVVVRRNAGEERRFLEFLIAAHERSCDYASVDWLFGFRPKKNEVSWNMMINRYQRTGGIARAREVFDGIGERDEVTWNSMIAAYVQVKNYGEELNLFPETWNSEDEATEVTIVSVLGACAEMVDLDLRRKIHDSLKQRRLRVDGYLGIELIDMYVKCGNLSLAWELFRELKMKPISC